MTEKKHVQAFAPGNISCFFTLYPHENPRWRGSSGLGFTVNEGVTVHVSRGKKTSVIFNGKLIIFPTVEFVIAKLTKETVSVVISSPLPLGSGFGLSGASALATAYALNELFDLGKDKKQLAVIAHTADVTEKTGLGDVVNQYFGGFLLKTKPSSHFDVQRIPLAETPVYWTSFSSLSTKDMLNNQSLMVKITHAADAAIVAVKNLLKKGSPPFASFMDVSYKFVKQSEILQNTKTRETIGAIIADGGHASMIIVGNAVMSDKPFPNAKKLFISERAAEVL